MEFAVPRAYADRRLATTDCVDPPRCGLPGGSMSDPSIKLQVLLRANWRSPQGLDKVREILASLGLTPTTGGLVTISAEVEPEKFKQVFGVTAIETAPQPPGAQEFGRSGGYSSPELQVPAALSEYVQSISAAPG